MHYTCTHELVVFTYICHPKLKYFHTLVVSRCFVNANHTTITPREANLQTISTLFSIRRMFSFHCDIFTFPSWNIKIARRWMANASYYISDWFIHLRMVIIGI
jgi:hypothetical protein